MDVKIIMDKSWKFSILRGYINKKRKHRKSPKMRYFPVYFKHCDKRSGSHQKALRTDRQIDK